ncbi:CRISPR-associated endonuclease Cas3'' [Desulforamulus profundi]|uniref:CRISPR-associated endonuclease Cas3'' n=1 Tax=Desulforamulus profundi TaxID=1383067 RepID=UPI003B75C1C1
MPVNKSLLKQIAITHDLGKAHPDFQAYLDKKGPGVNHAEPSAWFTYLLTHDLWAAEASAGIIHACAMWMTWKKTGCRTGPRKIKLIIGCAVSCRSGHCPLPKGNGKNLTTCYLTGRM